MKENPKLTMLSSIVKHSNLSPVSENQINISAYQDAETARDIQNNSLTFKASDLLMLSEEDIFSLSKNIAALFRRLSDIHNLSPYEDDMKFFNKGAGNGLIHELDHLKVIRKLRPELIHDASVNILAVSVPGNQMKVGMNVMIPLPEVPYTSYEKCQIQMAPRKPSDQDFYGLYMYIIQNGVADTEELQKILQMVRSKPDSDGKREFLRRLR